VRGSRTGSGGAEQVVITTLHIRSGIAIHHDSRPGATTATATATATTITTCTSVSVGVDVHASVHIIVVTRVLHHNPRLHSTATTTVTAATTTVTTATTLHHLATRSFLPRCRRRRHSHRPGRRHRRFCVAKHAVQPVLQRVNRRPAAHNGAGYITAVATPTACTCVTACARTPAATGACARVAATGGGGAGGGGGVAAR